MKPIKKLLKLLIILLTYTSSIAQTKDSLDCETLKKGRYYCSSPNGGFVYIERTKRKQIEKYENEKQRFTFKIHWIEPCVYELTLVKTKNVTKEIKKQIIGTVITYHIIEHKDNDYTVYYIDKEGNRFETVLYEND